MPKPTVRRTAPALPRVTVDTGRIENALVRMALSGMFALPDPIHEASRKALGPDGLMGRLPPNCIGAVESFIAKPKGAWTEIDYRRAAEFMGYWIDALQKRNRWQHSILVAERTPKKRGRKPTKLPMATGGLLTPSPPAPKGGRPKIWTREAEEWIVGVIDGVKAKHSLKQDSKAIQQLISNWAAEEGITPRALQAKFRRMEGCELEGTLRNGISRARKSLSKPPK